MSERIPPGALTSADNPLRVDWVGPTAVPSAASWTGRLGMTFLPGKHDRSMAGYHWRDLELDAARLRDVHEVDALVLLVEDHELVATATAGIAEAMGRHGIELIRYPIVDGGVAADTGRFRTMLMEPSARLRAGQSVVVACHGGLGRTGTVVACLLIEGGLDPASATVLTRAKRKGAIENAAQEAFVRDWEPTSPPGRTSPANGNL